MTTTDEWQAAERTARRRSLMTDMAVDVPEGTSGDVTVERFEWDPNSLEAFHAATGGRGSPPGIYTRLSRGQSLWMSDTHAERRDHLDAALEIDQRGGRVLIGGLGLGMILRVALLTPEVTHVDVVEIDPDVIALVGPHYRALAAEYGIGLTIHEDDMFRIAWPRGTRWNVAWFDIWRDLDIDNLDEMSKLRRSYGRRSDWNDCWGRHELLRVRRETGGWW